MTIPLSINLGQRGAGGVPDFTGRVDQLRGIVDRYEHSICDRFGFESMRTSFRASLEQALDWAREDQLGRPVEVNAPRGQKVWEGQLVEITIAIGRVQLVLSLKDMANRLIVRYRDPAGGQDQTSTYSNAASIATWGTKDRLLNLSTTLAAGADNRAQTALNQIAFPKSKQPSSQGSGDGGDISVELRFAGWYGALDWLLTSSTSTTSTAIDVQAVALLTAYNLTNNFYSTDRADVQSSSMPSDTEYIEPQSTYREKLETLLAQGDTAHQRLHWGIFDDRALTVRTWAGATPSAITYYESSRTGEIRDAYGNVVEPWLVRPDAMTLVDDVLDIEPPSDAIDGMTRKYVARVTCSISASGVQVQLEPDNVENLESILASPTGAGPAGTSERQAQIERKATAAGRPVFSGTNGTVDLGGTGSVATGGGSILTGGGSILTGGGSISTGGGSISTGGGSVTNTGGGAIDLGTGSGIGGAGSSGVSTTGGVSGRIAVWSGTNAIEESTLIKSGAGVLTLSAAADATLTVPATGTAVLGTGTSGRIGEWSGTNTVQASTLIKSGAGVLTLSAASSMTLTLSGGSATLDFTTPASGDALIYDGTKFTPTAQSGPTGSGTTGRVAEWASSSTLQASTLIKSGAGVLTLTAAATAGLTLIGTNTIDFTGASSGDVLSYNGSKFVSAAPALDGTGTTGRIAQWASSSSLQASTLIKSGAGVLTLSAASSMTLTLSGGSATLDFTTPASGDVLAYDGTKFTPTAAASGVSGSGAANKVAIWSSSSALTSDTNLHWDTTNNRLGINNTSPAEALHVTGNIRASGTLKTAANVTWDFGAATANPISATHTAQVSIGGTTYHVLLWDGGV